MGKYAESGDRSTVDRATAAALAAVVGVLCTQLHEGLGHGGACLLTGLHPRAWGAFYFDCELGAHPTWAGRIVEVAGSSVNLLVAIAAALAMRTVGEHRHNLKFFLWLTATVNAMVWAGYFLFSGVTGLGDWGVGQSGVLQGVSNPVLWRIAMFAAGLALYILITGASMRALIAITGGDVKGQACARRLCTLSYLTIGTIAVVVGLLNPAGFFILIASAAASSFGGASGLAWGQNMIKAGPARLFGMKRSPIVIAVAAALVLGEMAVLGPTIRFA